MQAGLLKTSSLRIQRLPRKNLAAQLRRMETGLRLAPPTPPLLDSVPRARSTFMNALVINGIFDKHYFIQLPQHFKRLEIPSR